MDEDSLKQLLKEEPKPAHPFTKVEPLDAAIEHGLGRKIGAGRAKGVLNRDNFFARQQEKVLRIMGPWESSGENLR